MHNLKSIACYPRDADLQELPNSRLVVMSEENKVNSTATGPGKNENKTDCLLAGGTHMVFMNYIKQLLFATHTPPYFACIIAILRIIGQSCDDTCDSLCVRSSTARCR